MLTSDYLTERISAWQARRDGRGGSLFHGRPRPGTGDLMLMSNDYLALGRHPAEVRAQVDALREHGNALLMSGVMVGDADPMRDLERRLAAFPGAPAVMPCQSGWAANTGLIQAIAPPAAQVCVDAAAHASLWAGIQAAGALTVPFAHNDCAHLERLIAVDTLYSVTGDYCPLADVVGRTGCELVAGESRTLGVVGPPRRGTTRPARRARPPIWSPASTSGPCSAARGPRAWTG